MLFLTKGRDHQVMVVSKSKGLELLIVGHDFGAVQKFRDVFFSFLGGLLPSLSVIFMHSFSTIPNMAAVLVYILKLI